MSSITPHSIAIIGCGIVGLSVATIIQKRYPDSQIDVYAARTNASTTSWGAPGFLRYSSETFKDTPESEMCNWLKESSEYFWNLYRSPNSDEAGVLLTNFYQISESPIIIPEKSISLYEGFRRVEEKELRAVGFSSKMKYGISFMSTLTESRYYLPFLMKKIQSNGANIIHKELSGGSTNIADWALDKGYNVVVNCSGLGSRDLFGDETIVPSRGQVVRVEAPWFKYSFLADNDTYAYSGKESVVLGSFRQKNDWDKTVRKDETSDILRRISEHNVCLGNSKIIEEWSGLRPLRPKLRLEIEHIKASNGYTIPVVHNYGHGPSGIGLSWGTSMIAVDLIATLMSH